MAPSLALLLPVLLPLAHAAEPVVAGDPELLVADPVTDDRPSAGRDYVTWVDQRTGNDEIYLQFLPEGDQYRVSDHSREDRSHSADDRWIAWRSEVPARPRPGESRAFPTEDLMVYDVSQRGLVYEENTQFTNETFPNVFHDRVAFETDAHRNGEGQEYRRVETMDLTGSHRFERRVVRDVGSTQLGPVLSERYVVFREETPTGWSIVAARVDTPGGPSEARVVATPPAHVGFGAPVVWGSQAAWIEYDRQNRTNHVHLVDLETGRTAGRWTALGEQVFDSVALKGKMMVAQVIDGSQDLLVAWCLPDGSPAGLPGFQSEGQQPVLTPWGSILYLNPGSDQNLRLYQRYVGCTTLPQPLSKAEESPGPDAMLFIAALLCAFCFAAARRRNPQ